MKHDSIKPPRRVSIREAKDTLPALIRAAEDGEQIVLTRNGKPVAELVRHKKSGGLDFEGLRRWKEENGIPRIVIDIPVDFDDPLPEDVLIRQLPE